MSPASQGCLDLPDPAKIPFLLRGGAASKGPVAELAKNRLH